MEMTIGANIKCLRTAKNITQEQLSVAMNITCAAVSKWERGETYPDITLLQPLAYYFGVTLDELMGYDQEKVQAEIDDVITLYRKHWKSDYKRRARSSSRHTMIIPTITGLCTIICGTLAETWLTTILPF